VTLLGGNIFRLNFCRLIRKQALHENGKIKKKLPENPVYGIFQMFHSMF
jgi:hypothetical protein